MASKIRFAKRLQPNTTAKTRNPSPLQMMIISSLTVTLLDSDLKAQATKLISGPAWESIILCYLPCTSSGIQSRFGASDRNFPFTPNPLQVAPFLLISHIPQIPLQYLRIEEHHFLPWFSL